MTEPVRQIAPKRTTRDPRFDFKKREKIAMFKRAGGPENLRCERCSLPIGGKPFDYHHNPAVWTWTEEKRQRVIKEGLTSEDGEVLGHCCHAPQTSADSADRSKGKRIVAKAARAEKKYSKPIPGSKASGWRHKVNGTWERR
jgi:hypothetical protein